MIKNNFITIFVFAAGFFLLAVIQVQTAYAQTDEELKRQIEAQEKRNEMLRKLKALKDEEKQLLNTDAQPRPTVSPTPDNNNSGNRGGAANLNPANVVPAIQRIRDLFNPDSTGKFTVCQLQDLEKANFNRFDKNICDLAKELVRNTKDSGDKKILFEPTIIQDELAIFLLAKFAGMPKSEVEIDKNIKDFVLEIENKRNDKQIGADSKGAGTTSLATRGGIPRFLSWAVENGGITGEKDGNTLTFRVNPVGFAESLSRDGGLPGFFAPRAVNPNPVPAKNEDQFTREMRKLSVGFSFDITRGTDSPVFIGNRQQLSAVSFKYNFINRKDPLNPVYRKDWDELRATAQDPYSQSNLDFYNQIVAPRVSTDPAKFSNASLEIWRRETEEKLQKFDVTADQNFNELVEKTRLILLEQVAALPIDSLRSDASFIKAVREYALAQVNYVAAKDKLREKIAKGAVMSVEYTNYREVNAPDLSNFRFVVEKGLVAGWNFTGNASVSIYNTKPAAANAKRIRDFDFTLQLEKTFKLFGGEGGGTIDETPFSRGIRLGNPVFSFAGQYQRLPEDIAALDGLVKANTKGDIAVGQFKLVIPIDNLGIKIPISMSFANRTELIKESTVRGNFGITFDLDRLLLGNLFKLP